jgi:hypothetical protein
MLDRKQVIAAVKPLRFIFWGGLLWLFDLTFTYTSNGSGFRIDLLDDTVGTLLITVAVFRLSRAPVSIRYERVMVFLKTVAIASVISTAIHHVVFEKPSVFVVMDNLFGLCQLLATILFCTAMQWFSQAADLHKPADSWRVTSLLFIVLYVVPLGILYIVSLGATLTGSTLRLDIGFWIIPLLMIFAIPIAHLFISTSRMGRAAAA